MPTIPDLRRIADEWNSGGMSRRDLVAAKAAYKHSGVGFSYRWDAVVPVASQTVATWAREMPDEFNADGHWVGPIGGGPNVKRSPVVYMLFRDERLIYIGSTGHLRSRLKMHRDKGFDIWRAWTFPTRGDAYVAEGQWIEHFRPPLNYTAETTAFAGSADRSLAWPPPTVPSLEAAS